MSRRHSAEKREIIPDPKFGDVVVTKFMNSIMYEGKKSVAESIVYGAFDQIEQLPVFDTAPSPCLYRRYFVTGKRISQFGWHAFIQNHLQGIN